MIYRNCLELGAGVGLVGLYCLRDLNPQKYILTDHHDLVLNQLEANLKLNFNDETSTIMRLDWINSEEFNAKDLDLDLILASGKLMLF